MAKRLVLLTILALLVLAPAATAQTANITITSPAQGEVIGNLAIAVTGTGTALPENNVVVQVLDANRNVLAETPTTVNAELGGTGDWSVALNYDATPGTSGSIYAFANSPADGSLLAEAEVNVTFGPIAQPSITITSPANGETVVTERGFTVSGTATDVFENNVVVTVINSEGAEILRQATTADTNGSWTTMLMPGILNGPGRIEAFSTSPQDGSIVAIATVNVNFSGTVAPASVVITTPVDGAVVNTTTPFVVNGTAANIFENNVIVRVRDAQNRTVRETVTTADLNGNWSVSIDLLIANEATGSLYAFSTSPVDGSVVAESLVRVTFASACEVREDWPIYTVQGGDLLFSIAQQTGSTVSELTVANCLPNPNQIFPGEELRVPRLPGAVQPPETADASLMILTPDVNGVLLPDGAFNVTGSSEGTQQDNIFVRLLDTDGNVLHEIRAEATPTGTDNTFNWQANFEALGVEPGTRGMVFAYALSLADGRIVASDTVSISYGTPTASTPFITITSPTPYSNPALGQITVTGRAAGLFEGNVVVQAIDDNGSIIAQQPTIINAPDAGTGGEGPWEVTLNVDEIRRGRIVAFSTSPQDGSVTASAGVDVIFGDPTSLPTYVLMTYPLPQTVITSEQSFVAVVGYASGVFNDSVSVTLLDENGGILLSQPVTVNPATGFWALTTDANADIVAERNLRIQVIATSPSNGAIIAADSVPVIVLPVGETAVGENTVSGTVTYLPRIALVPGQTVTVQLQDISLADAPATLIGEQVITITDQQVPIPFSIAYDPAQIEPGRTYSLRATITTPEGDLQFTTTQVYPVITQDNPTSGIELIVDMVN